MYLYRRRRRTAWYNSNGVIPYQTNYALNLSSIIEKSINAFVLRQGVYTFLCDGEHDGGVTTPECTQSLRAFFVAVVELLFIKPIFSYRSSC